jgi:hypothetical protein
MAINLSGYTDIETGLFVKIQIQNYRTTEAGGATSEVLLFSDYYRTVIIDGETYLPLGQLVSIGTSRSEIRASSDSMNITISGIPNENVQEILYSDIKGSLISVYRVIFDSNTGDILAITGNPAGRFFGYVNNYSTSNEIDVLALEGTTTVSFECGSFISLLNTFVNGRRTNPVDQKQLYPNDTSFDRVPTLVGSNYNFGAPK